MRVKVQFISASVPTEFDNVKDVYTKDGLLCLSFIGSNRIIKFPLVNIFAIDSDYEYEKIDRESKANDDE